MAAEVAAKVGRQGREEARMGSEVETTVSTLYSLLIAAAAAAGAAGARGVAGKM